MSGEITSEQIIAACAVVGTLAAIAAAGFSGYQIRGLRSQVEEARLARIAAIRPFPIMSQLKRDETFVTGNLANIGLGPALNVAVFVWFSRKLDFGPLTEARIHANVASIMESSPPDDNVRVAVLHKEPVPFKIRLPAGHVGHVQLAYLVRYNDLYTIEDFRHGILPVPWHEHFRDDSGEPFGHHAGPDTDSRISAVLKWLMRV